MMEPLNPSRPADHVALQMENELLAHEVAHLRARLAHRSAPGSVADPDEVHLQAYYDVRWLMRRLEGSPASPLLHRFEGYNTLAERYLGDDA